MAETTTVDPATDTYEGALDLEGLEDVRATAPEGTKAEEPDKPAAEPAKEPAKGDLTIALRQARERASAAKAALRTLEDTRAAEVSNRTAPRANKIEVKPAIKPERLDEIKKRAAGLDTFDQVAELVVTEVTKDLGAVMQGAVDDLQRQQGAVIFDLQVQRMGDRLRNKLARETDDPDHFDKVVKAAGYGDALQVDPATGTVRDLALAKQVFSKADPAQELYNLALAKLEEKGELDALFPAKKEPEVPREPAAPRAPVAREPDRVPAAPPRPRSIASLPSAGVPSDRSGRPTRAEIDDMADRNPAAYSRLMAKNPGLRQWYLHGTE